MCLRLDGPPHWSTAPLSSKRRRAPGGFPELAICSSNSSAVRLAPWAFASARLQSFNVVAHSTPRCGRSVTARDGVPIILIQKYVPYALSPYHRLAGFFGKKNEPVSDGWGGIQG